MPSRRSLLQENGIILPRKLFCLDFKDTSKNTTTKITDTINGIELTKASAGTTTFITDPNFGRCLKVTSRSKDNVYSRDWAATYQTIFGAGETLWARKPLTYVAFTNSMGYGSSTRSGLMAIYNKGQIIAWQGGTVFSYSGSSFALGMGRVSYLGKTLNSDIGMYVVGSDYANKHRIQSKSETGFSLLAEYTTAYTPTSPTTGTFVFLRSQEYSYYFAANGICAGFSIYDGVLTNEQVAYIFENYIKS